MREALEGFLKSKGFDVEMLGGQCPFQIEANHCSGLSVYFRSRGQTASLEIYNEHYDYFSGLPDDSALVWTGRFQCWEPYMAGYLDFLEAFYVFYQLWSDAKEIVEELNYCTAIASDSEITAKDE